MQLAMIGLGKMGANMAQRLMQGGHDIIAYDPNEDAVKASSAKGMSSLKELAEALPSPRAIWMMVPAGEIVDQTIAALRPHLQSGDILIDGGNSNYKDTMRRGTDLANDGIQLVDCGTSGGVWGLKEGYSLMIGGESAAVESLRPIFECLAPAADRGWGHVGPRGAGHFTKMIHNGIEYGMMQAYAEGFSILKHKPDFDLDLHQVGKIWQHGSVVRSWLLDLTVNALSEDQDLSEIAPWVSDSGEGRWTVFEAIDLNIPAPVATLSLIARLRSRDDESYSDRLIAAMRNQFGGHAIKKNESS